MRRLAPTGRYHAFRHAGKDWYTMNHGVATDLETVRGVLLEKHDGGIILGLPGTDYRLHLKVHVPIDTAEGKPLQGIIEAQAMRIDHTAAGGRFIEPIYGRPRRLQGRVTGVDTTEGRVAVRCACPVRCRVGRGQDTSDFSVGDFVTFDIEPNALFVPAS